VDVGSPLVTYLKPPVAVQSRQSPLHPPRCLPKLSLDSITRRAMRGVMPLFLKASRQCGKW